MLFFEFIGCIDIFFGDEEVLMDIIRIKLLILFDKIVVYLGYGKLIIIGYEKENNFFLKWK